MYTKFDEIDDRLDDIEVQLSDLSDTVEEIRELLQIILNKLGMDETV